MVTVLHCLNSYHFDCVSMHKHVSMANKLSKNAVLVDELKETMHRILWRKNRARGLREFQIRACQHLYVPYHAEIIFHKQFGKCTLLYVTYNARILRRNQRKKRILPVYQDLVHIIQEIAWEKNRTSKSCEATIFLMPN